MSDIRVSVLWKSSTVFAGEELECIITFKNASQAHRYHHSSSPGSQSSRHDTNRDRRREVLPLGATQGQASSSHTKPSSIPTNAPQNTKIHEPALSLSTYNGFANAPSMHDAEGVSKVSNSGKNKHKSSVSIVSIGGDAVNEARSPGSVLSTARPIRGHVRAASLQLLPRSMVDSSSGSLSAPGHDRAFTVSSPLLRSTSSSMGQHPSSRSTPRTRPYMGSVGSLTAPSSKKSHGNSSTSFKFPQGPDSTQETLGQFSSAHANRSSDSVRRALSPRPHGPANSIEQSSPHTNVLASTSTNDTPRSSGEIYSMSNNSSETLASEYISRKTARLIHKPVHSRQNSSLAPPEYPMPEVLMMGYAQLAGSFILDGSLINQNPFEAAKKKGMVGGQQGVGVVRSESTKRDSGLLGSLSWGQIGESLGGLLGSSEMSSIREAKSTSNSRSIPILSTPQSILFVDLQLGPGESASYTYRHPLPKGIPPSHKGRAIKTWYSLVVGTQRATKSTPRHQIRHADVPFKVLTGVNEQGDILGHDLMVPHIILSNNAKISSVQSPQFAEGRAEGFSSFKKFNSSSIEFQSYIENLQVKTRQNSSARLLSPTEPSPRFPTAIAEGVGTMKDFIDSSILKSNAATPAKRSANRFELTRSGDRVAVIMLARPAYRLGETIPVVIDFRDSTIQCYSLHSTLETSESIDPTIALRSKTSIQRVTRRIHASQSDSTIATNKVMFNPVIPFASTPDFITSAISFEWKLRFEFVTSQVNDPREVAEDLDNLEEVARDERGTVKVAVQGLPCETFDITVPLKVYGATPGFDGYAEPDEFPI